MEPAIRPRLVYVRCPAEPTRIKCGTLPVTTVNGEPFALPFIGCDDYAMSPLCEACAASVTMAFTNGTLDGRKTSPYIPDLS